MIAAQRFTVSCSAASAIASGRDDIARTKNNFFIGYMNASWNPGQSGSQEIYLPSDRCRDGPGLNLGATRFFRRIQQKLAAAKINGSRPFAHTKNSLLPKAGDRLILESQLTPGLDTGLHGRALVNIIVHCSRTR